jgi:hypothetical protein
MPNFKNLKPRFMPPLKKIVAPLAGAGVGIAARAGAGFSKDVMEALKRKKKQPVKSPTKQPSVRQSIESHNRQIQEELARK